MPTPHDIIVVNGPFRQLYDLTEHIITSCGQQGLYARYCHGCDTCHTALVAIQSLIRTHIFTMLECCLLKAIHTCTRIHIPRRK